MTKRMRYTTLATARSVPAQVRKHGQCQLQGNPHTRCTLRASSALAASLAAAAVVTAARVSGSTKGLLDGTRSSCSVCAKKQTRRRQPSPSLHSCVRYLRRHPTVSADASRSAGRDLSVARLRSTCAVLHSCTAG